MTQENFERAIAATKVGLYVFPWRTIIRGGKEAKTPLTPNGHLAATLDPEQIATWFLSEFPSADTQIGVHAGASGLVVADLDRKGEKNGFESSAGWLEFPDTWEQMTPGNGVHRVYIAPEGMHLAPSADFQGFLGLDVRAGSSWIGLYDEPPSSRDAFSPAPEWLLDEKPARRLGASYDGALPEWMDSVDADSDPTGRILDLIQRIPDGDLSHSDMVELQYNAIRLGAEGNPGAAHALQILRDAWLSRDSALHGTPESMWAWKFDEALVSGVKKAGALDEKIANLPAYIDLLDDWTVAEEARSTKRGKADWFRHARVFIRHVESDNEVASLLWSAPATKDWSRDWGIEYVYTKIVELRAEVEADDARAQAEVERFADPEKPTANSGISLLSDDEREYLAERPNFIHRYVDTARERFSNINEPYHRANAWSILSLAFGTTGFVTPKGKTLGLNLYQNVTGESGSGKSDSIIMRDQHLQLFFAGDGTYDFGSEASAEVMHEDLLNRGGSPTFFNSDEAAVFYRELNRPGSWQAKLQDRLTDWYGGWVGPVKKRGMSGNGGPCYLVTQFFATPNRLFDSMTTEQFDSGFLARFLWSRGEDAVEEIDDIENMQDSGPVDKDVPPEVEEFVNELKILVTRIGARRPYRADRHGLKRLVAAHAKMQQILKERSDWTVTGSSYRRMKDSLLKCCGILAASRGSTDIELIDILGALEQMEIWVDGLIYASSQVSASVFEREAREIAHAVKVMGNPWVTEARLSNKFSRYNEMEWKQRCEWMVRQGLVVVEEANRDHQRRFGWKGKEVEE